MVSFNELGSRHIGINLLIGLILYLERHFLKHFLILIMLLQVGLQIIIHGTHLTLLDVNHTQITYLAEKRFVVLMINKEREFLHFGNHTSLSSFLFS